MKKYCIKIVAIFFAALFIINIFPNGAFAAENSASKIINGYQFEGDINKYLEKKINQELQKKMSDAKVSEWYAEYEEPIYKAASGYAGNQPTAGTSFGSTGGAFHYSSSGGPSANVSATIGGPWGSVSFGVNLGQCVSTTEYIINAPSAPGYYKLWVIKTMCIKPYTLYTKQSGTNTWNAQYFTMNELYSIEFRVDKVG